MEVKEVTSQQVLDNFVGSLSKSQFLQSWDWGEFQASQQNYVLRLGAYKDDTLIGSAQIIKQILPLGKKYWYCPRGPVVDEKMPVEQYQEVWQALIQEIVGRADDDKALFVKIEPPIEVFNQPLLKKLLDKYNIRLVNFVQPQDSWYLDLRKSEKDILAAMHQKTRYNIRLAEKRGVKVRTDSMIDDFETFWRLLKSTTQRDKFHSHSQPYYHDMYRLLVQNGFMGMFIAELDGKIIAANLVVYFGDTVVYLHGASSDEYRNVMAPHLLQWRQIQSAKQEGYKYYDFWGVAPDDYKGRHHWAGITRFKKGFGGYRISFVGAYDLILDKLWYKLYKSAQKFKLR